jgi:hypothetical protein
MDRAVDGAQREEIPLTYFIAQHCIGTKAADFIE